MRNVRNPERESYIYNARKIDKRSFADIGLELGITGTRVSALYKRIDWERNGLDADHHRKEAKASPSGMSRIEEYYRRLQKGIDEGRYRADVVIIPKNVILK